MRKTHPEAYAISLPPLNALHTFEVVARYLSFQRAAEGLDITPISVSYQIKVLEDHLGVSLFRRRPRPLALTEERYYSSIGTREINYACSRLSTAWKP